MDEDVWLRMRATDASGLSFTSSSRRIRVDNTAAGLLFEPHPGEDHVALHCEVVVRFEARPTRPDGSAMDDAELASVVALRDGTGAAVSCAASVLETGRVVRLLPAAPLQPRHQYTIQITQTLNMGGKLMPMAASTFTTTFGSPTSLRLSARSAYPQAGATWDPPLEVMIVDTLGNRVEDATGWITLSLTTDAGTTLGAYDSPADQGVARFRNVRTERAGRLRVSMTCPSLSLTNTEAIDVLPGALASFQLEVPEQIQAGQPIFVVASAYDAFGNLKTDFSGAPSLASADPKATLNPLPAFRPQDHGRRSYSEVGTLRSLGIQWLQLYGSQATSSRETIRIANAPPLTPEAVAPRRMASCGLAARLMATGFVDEDNASHGASQWQVAEDALFQAIVWDSGITDAVNIITVPAGLLVANHVYYWRVRYLDDPPNDDPALWSSWSAPAAMQTVRSFPFVDDFSQDQGWQVSPDGLWTRTPASGLLAGSPPDDTSASDDGLILTTALNGGPPATFTSPYRIISPAVDCSTQTLVQLSFKRWLDIDSSDWAQAEVAVSVDGTNWIPLWRNGPDGVNDESWQEQRFDLTEIAAGQPTVYVSFSLGPQYQAMRLPGWHIDDVRLENGDSGLVVASLSVTSTNLTQGDEFDCRLLVREQVPEANGFLGGAFGVVYDASGLQLVSPTNANQIVSPPFKDVKTEGTFTAGRITGLGGATLTQGYGNGQDAVFAILRFRATQSGSFTVTLAAGEAGCVLTTPVGLVPPARVQCGQPITMQVSPAPIVYPLEFRLEGPTNPVPVGNMFEVRVAVRENHSQAHGFLGGAVDLFFEDTLVQPVTPLVLTSIVHTAFQSLGILSGEVAESRIDELGGVTLTTGQADGTFITYLRVPFQAKQPGHPVFELGPSQAGVVLASPVGQLAPQDVDWGLQLELTITDLRPRIEARVLAGGLMELSWSACEDCVLQTSETLTNPVWRNIPESRGTNTFQVPITGNQGYFRLERINSPQPFAF